MSDLRQRKPPAAAGETLQDKIKREDESDKPLSASITLIDILRILGGILILNTALSYFITGDKFTWGYKPWFTKPGQLQNYLRGPLLLTDSELSAFDGGDPSKPIYLALNGTIYDVSAGKTYYGPGGMYGFFSGRDGSRAFITGCFDIDLTPDMRGVEEMYVPKPDPEKDAELTPGQLKARNKKDWEKAREQVRAGIQAWEKVFRGDTGKDYFEVGKVKREKGWLEKMPVRDLCEPAQKKRRPRRPGQ